MATVLDLRERLRGANHLNLTREGWESWLFWFTLIQDCLTLCTCFFQSTWVCTYFFYEITHPPLKKKTVGLFRDFLIEKFLPLLLRKKKVFGVFCTSSSLLAIWFRCTVLSFYSACQIFFQVRFISVLSLLAKFCRQNSFTWSFNFPHALEGYCWLFVC